MTHLIRAALFVLSLATIPPVANAAPMRPLRSSKIGPTAKRRTKVPNWVAGRVFHQP
jgi:hypothetical protein